MTVILSAMLALSSILGVNVANPDIISSPEVILYDNMAPGYVRSQFVEVTNKGKENVKISPKLVIENELAEGIDVKITVCNSEWKNEECDKPTSILTLSSGETEKVLVTVSIDENMTTEFSAISGKGKLVFISENDVNDDSDLARTGVDSSMWLKLSGAALLSGLLLTYASRKKRTM